MNRSNSNRSGKKPNFKPKAQGNDKPFKKKAAPKKMEPSTPKENPDEIRLNRYVKVNGNVITEMGFKVKPGDVVNFDGSEITPGKKEYYLLNKPKNFTTSGEDSGSTRNVLELLKGTTSTKLQAVGRMDKSTTGLLLLTNDTNLVLKFSKPQQKSTKIYQVSLDRNLKFEDLEHIAAGVTLDGHRIYADEVSYIENQPKTEIGIQLRTANVKVVRAIFEHYKYDVLKVDRVSFAGLTKKNLPRGFFRHLTDQEIINLKNI